MKVAVIGNGTVSRDISKQVDACDYVIRMNMVHSFGELYGTKLDCLALCNTGVAAKTVMDPRKNKFIAQAPQIVLTRNPALYSEMCQHFAGQQTQQFFEDFSHLATRPEYRHAEVRWVDYVVGLDLTNKLPRFSDEPFIMPSTGMRVIEELIAYPRTFRITEPVEQIFVAGFSYEGWPGHPWAGERALTDHYVAEGLVTRMC